MGATQAARKHQPMDGVAECPGPVLRCVVVIVVEACDSNGPLFWCICQLVCLCVRVRVRVRVRAFA